MAEDHSSEEFTGEIIASPAYEAFLMKQGGISLQEIAETLGYRSARDVNNDIQQHLKDEAQRLTSNERESLLTLQNLRYEALLKAAWPAATMGDPKSIDVALRVMAGINKVNQLEMMDTSTQQSTVLVLSDAQDDYLKKLKEIVEPSDGS